MKAKKTKIGTIQARVYRASTETWENKGTIFDTKVGVISKIITKIKTWLR